MRLLILGGTVFVGRHLAEVARDRGHDVTLFHRGTRPDVLPDVEHLHGDRNEPAGLDVLREGTWDAVIDTSAYLPRQVREALDALEGRFDRYAFVSSISVYEGPYERGPHEDAPLAQLDDPDTETIDGETYGGLKVVCERVLQKRLGSDLSSHDPLIVRPGIVVGPHDPTERYTYWVRRMTRPGPVLVPDVLDAPAQWIDARDLARFVLDGLESGLSGTFNVVTEEDAHTIGDVLDACAAVVATAAAGSAEADSAEAASDAPAGETQEHLVVPESFLLRHDVTPFSEMPLWIPGDSANLMRSSAARARAAGLTTRSLKDSLRDLLAWDQGRDPAERKDLLSPERERELVEAWQSGQDQGFS